ncbi:ChaN family lipoprotein [Marinigracilibium pacificum]|uniref:ChaN family lipoprotein n=1 Tax=Marinigracilibium pacificum TaxID=2729599 RepID=A0A848J132_9BACT|nr:ChaN family lipoprotein [Marinigracilibium pacificum]NMM49381.1 ChaN family lipoprotein [Marinigracilibium pacificum]
MRSLNFFYLPVILFFFSFPVQSQNSSFSLYQAFDSEGNSVQIPDKLNEIKNADVIFFGELHNQAVSHWLSLRILKSLPTEGLVAGFEMFETDQQMFLNELELGIITNKKLESVTHLWPNYSTDYAPLVDYSLSNSVSLLASNVPRRYASIVSKVGLDSLLLMQLPSDLVPEKKFDLPDYDTYNQIKQMGGHGHTMNMDYFVEAQALKDYTMATSIAKEFENGAKKVFHLNGSFHSTQHEGIIGFLTNKNPGLSVFTIEVIMQEEINQLEKENLNKADLIIVIPSDSPVTY